MRHVRGCRYDSRAYVTKLFGARKCLSELSMHLCTEDGNTKFLSSVLFFSKSSSLKLHHRNWKRNKNFLFVVKNGFKNINKHSSTYVNCHSWTILYEMFEKRYTENCTDRHQQFKIRYVEFYNLSVNELTDVLIW